MPTRLRLLPLLVALAGPIALPAVASASRHHRSHHRSHHVTRRVSRAVPSTVACAGVNVVPTAAGLAQAASTLLCLVNQQRAAAGLAPLSANAQLSAAATRQTNDMVAAQFFDHTSPTGLTMDQRISDSGYERGAAGWNIGENLIWASGSLTTPAALVNGWMHSPEHRANILGSYRDTGFGIALGAPTSGVDGAVTVTEDFGSRS